MPSELIKITASVILELGQIERLNEVAEREGVSRSVIVRNAIERELKRFESKEKREDREKDNRKDSNKSSTTT